MTTISIYEETLSGERTSPLTVEFPVEVVTAEELIRRYVYEMVKDINQRETDRVREIEASRQAAGANEKERLLNASRPISNYTPSPRRLHWEDEANRALEAFQRNRFFLLVDNRQILTPEEPLSLRPETQISFLRLMPLAGG